ncbi:cobalamin biosynthesis protein CbiL [uncultured Roseibium sp.]|uniref:cobalamin biosynthesis protein CbiL n=1 Tax=uncultured Roseibium sp. TaxID=1936171 RepID=UPI003216ADDC
MIRFLLLSLLLLPVLAAPAEAHKLKVFATVEGDTVAGYAFFIGGGRAKGTPWTAKDAAGTVMAEGKTDDEGRYRFTPSQPVTSDITVTVNTQEGHIAFAVIAASRFGGNAAAGTAAAAPTAASAAPAASPSQGTSQPVSDERIAMLVESAVQRQLEPLLERIEQMDDRLRFSDILSGIFLIIGLAGIGLWARARK